MYKKYITNDFTNILIANMFEHNVPGIVQFVTKILRG